MTAYSYPFKDEKEWKKFWKSFDNVERTDILEVNSKAVINNVQCEGKVYYITGTFARKWRGLKADKQTYVFQIGEHKNVHGHFINCDISELLAKNDLCPWQKSYYWACPSSMDPHRKNTIHLPQIEKNQSTGIARQNCWDTLWGMIQGLRDYDGKSLSSMNMKDWWDLDRMRWVGPFVIGHLKGLDEFQEYHQSRFLEFIPDRNGLDGKNKVIFSDGNYAGLCGHPSMSCTHKGEYFGFKPENRQPRLFVMDFWSCENNRLVDNWCQIDMIDLFRSINSDYERMIDETLHYTR